MTAFEVVDDPTPSGTVIAVRGELDIATTPRLRDAVERAAGAATLTIDLTATEFVDSTACGYLLQVAKQAEADGRAVAFVCPEGNWDVRRVFDILGLLPALGLAPPED